jgi:hypothetical protein
LIADPCAARVTTDLEESDFLSGCITGRWRIVSFDFPRLDFVVSAIDPSGKQVEFGFRAELSNYPAQAPLVRIWDLATNQPLAVNFRPKGGNRIQITFQQWGSDTVYRPWDRMTGPHNNNAINHPHLAWRPERRLAFIFEDLHGILNSNARTHRIRATA